MAFGDGNATETQPLLDQEPWQDEVPEPSMTGSTDIHVRSSSSSDIEGGRLPLPVWMREQSAKFHWNWIPLSFQKYGRSLASWSKGPDPPKIQKITPFFPFIQEAPLKLVDKLLPKKLHKAGALVALDTAWILIFTLILRSSASSGDIEGYGQPSPIWCGANFWCVHKELVQKTIH